VRHGHEAAARKTYTGRLSERVMSKERKLQIRNRTAEFLIFTRQAGEEGIEVRVAEETVWLTQKLMAALFEVTVPTINEHLANLYARKEISEPATIRNFRTVQKEGNREVVREVEHLRNIYEHAEQNGRQPSGISG
jgi:hypothetical protein